MEQIFPNGEIPMIRFFNVYKNAASTVMQNVEGIWATAIAENIHECSSVAFFFAFELYKNLNIPIGIIHASWGATRVEAWISRNASFNNPFLKEHLLLYEASPFIAEAPDIEDRICQHCPADPGNLGEAKRFSHVDFDDSDWEKIVLPGSWRKNGFDFNGSFWFRKEIIIPKEWVGHSLRLYLGCIDKHDCTYFNGQRVGATGCGFETKSCTIPRKYIIPSSLIRAGRNIIAVRVYSFIYDAGFNGPITSMRLELNQDTTLPLAGQWKCKPEHQLGIIQLPQPRYPNNPNAPHSLFDGMIYPLIPYAIGGVIWYQGESNVVNSAEYGSLMTSLINDWRFQWGQGNFPFLIVQLPSYGTPAEFQITSSWARVREHQRRLIQQCPETGLAITIDLEEANSLHPKDKTLIGKRLAWWLLHHKYHNPAPASGPLFIRMERDKSTVRLYFDQLLNGHAKMQIAGNDGIFHSVDAIINENTVIVSSPEVPVPQEVRYAWADNPIYAKLTNSLGMPASPFTTSEVLT
jgi:sialate O-acetylesterase